MNRDTEAARRESRRGVVREKQCSRMFNRDAKRFDFAIMKRHDSGDHKKFRGC